MEPLFIPVESDFKKWIKDAVQEFLNEYLQKEEFENSDNNQFLNRKEIAAYLRISLVTLTDWVKRGLPSHPQRGRIYFDKKEVMDYIKDKKLRQLKLGSKLYRLKNEID